MTEVSQMNVGVKHGTKAASGVVAPDANTTDLSRRPIMSDTQNTAGIPSRKFLPLKAQCESPIELALACAIVRAIHADWDADCLAGVAWDLYEREPDEQPATTLTRMATLVLTCQLRIGTYRADMALGCLAWAPTNVIKKMPPVIVECDGHQFHEKTKEQAQHDKERDRFITAKGYRIFRFTGSEIMRRPNECAIEVLDALYVWARME
jgi:very-short-patch-repair endonuclease